MAELTIRLTTNLVTGKKDVVVELKSDGDALPMEHEQLHRTLVSRLLAGGLVSAQELGELVIERAASPAVPASPRAASTEAESRSAADNES